MKPITAATLVLLALSGCAESPDAHYFALDPVPPRQPPPDLAGPPIMVQGVHLPPILDRLEMVGRGPDNTVIISPHDRWAAPLDEMTARVWAEDLADRLPPARVIGPGMPKPPLAWVLTFTAREFDAQANGRVTLDAEWTLLTGTPPLPLLRQAERIEVATTTTGQAAAMSEALATLADRVVARLATGTVASLR